VSAWAGSSSGVKHVKAKLPGTAGSTLQLRFEYTQDSNTICSVPPCGVAVDNIVVQSVVAMKPTVTTLAASPSPAPVGASVTLTATVGCPVTPQGSITFKDGGTVIGGPIAVSGGTASFSTASLAVGTHALTAEFTPASGEFTTSNGGTSLSIVTFAAPTNVVATATSPTSVMVSWSPVLGAVSYKIFRRQSGGSFGLINTSSTTSYDDTTASPDSAYLYEVRGVDSGANETADSAPDLATTFVFDDDPLIPGTTTLRAVHFEQLRTAINAVRVLGGLAATVFTDPTWSNLPVAATHIAEMRTALDEARVALALPALSYTDSTITPGTTILKAAHITELRNGVR